MAKKVRVISLFLIVFIIATAFAGISVVRAKNIDSVGSFKVSQSGLADNCTLSWKNVRDAEGYYIYILDDKSDNYIKYCTVDDGKAEEYTVVGLKPSKVHFLKIQAYKTFRDKEYVSELSEKVKVYTCPAQIKLHVDSVKAGELEIKWQPDSNVSGYEIQYSKNESFNDDSLQKQAIKDSSKGSLSIKSLEQKSEYFVRIRAYFNISGDKVLYGAWSDRGTVTVAHTVKMRTDIDKDKPMVALSFDDGPSFNTATKRVLDTLEKHGARATFYIVGSRLNKTTTKQVKRMVELGCELGNHTYDHKRYGKNVKASDISKCSDAINKAVGERPTSFRCPGGIMSSTIQKQAKKEDMMIAHWSVDTLDWKSKDSKKIYNRATKYAYDGCIILMHDIYETTADATEKIVPALIKQGYQIVTVSELIQAKTGKEPKAGEQYIDYKTINNNTK